MDSVFHWCGSVGVGLTDFRTYSRWIHFRRPIQDPENQNGKGQEWWRTPGYTNHLNLNKGIMYTHTNRYPKLTLMSPCHWFDWTDTPLRVGYILQCHTELSWDPDLSDSLMIGHWYNSKLTPTNTETWMDQPATLRLDWPHRQPTKTMPWNHLSQAPCHSRDQNT